MFYLKATQKKKKPNYKGKRKNAKEKWCQLTELGSLLCAEDNVELLTDLQDWHNWADSMEESCGGLNDAIFLLILFLF